MSYLSINCFMYRYSIMYKRRSWPAFFVTKNFLAGKAAGFLFIGSNKSSNSFILIAFHCHFLTVLKYKEKPYKLNVHTALAVYYLPTYDIYRKASHENVKIFTAIFYLSVSCIFLRALLSSDAKRLSLSHITSLTVRSIINTERKSETVMERLRKRPAR